MKLSLVLAVLLFQLNLFADSYFVKDTKGNGVSKDTAESVTDLVKTAVKKHKQDIAVSENSATWSIQTKVLKLGDSIMVVMDKSKGSKVEFSSQLKAKTIDEIDVIVTRLARSVIKEIPVEEDSRVQDVTATEQENIQRKKTALQRYQFGMGPHVSSNLGTSNSVFGAVLGANWEISERNEARGYIHFISGDNTQFVAAGLGIQYFFTDTTNAFYISPSLAYAGAKDRTYNENVTGFAIGLGGGYQFFRTSNVKMDVGIQTHYLLRSNQLGSPVMTGLLVSLYL